MAPQIFITGITGYIGGQTLATLFAKHPEYSIVGLARKEEDKQKILAKFPSIKIIIGDLDAHTLLVEQCKEADVVIHTADADHIPAIKSITEGLAASPKPGVYLHLSGAASIIEAPTGYGNLSPKVWDDIVDLETITTFKEPTYHVASDQLVLSEGKRLSLKTALIVPPIVYARGEGAIKKQSIALPMLKDQVVKRGKMFRIGEAKQAIATVHVKDLANAFVFFTEEALRPSGGSAVEWGGKGVYYVAAEEAVFVDIVNAMAKAMFARGLIGSLEVDEVDAEEAGKIHPWAPFLWGGNMRCTASRLRALGWKPKQADIMETIAELFD